MWRSPMGLCHGFHGADVCGSVLGLCSMWDTLLGGSRVQTCNGANRMLPACLQGLSEHLGEGVLLAWPGHWALL